ncbi:MAG: hypothetical protein APF76_00555 [Desulfitibacter sp. BRH_c19]|nr:MAG: hypothetical protein APF76_00555 [Desulfitibacter sp. BRH_c19]
MGKKNVITLVLLLVVVGAAFAMFFLQDTEKSEGTFDILSNMDVLNGEMISEADFSARPTLVVKWATWCPTCVDELLYLKDNHQEFQERVNLLAINITGSERNTNDVINLIDSYELPFLVLADMEDKSSKHFPAKYIPANFLLNTNGEVVNSLEGPIDLETLDEWLENM